MTSTKSGSHSIIEAKDASWGIVCVDKEDGYTWATYKEGGPTTVSKPERAHTKFDCKKVLSKQDPKHLGRLLHDILEKKLFCNGNGQLTIKGIMISFKKKKKDLKTIIGPGALGTVPIYILELFEGCSDPILGTLKSSQEYLQGKSQVLT